MSSVASSNASDASDAASTTGSTNSVASDARTVASATSGASATSTVPSTVNTANTGTDAATVSKRKSLKEWYSSNLSTIAKYLKADPRTPPTATPETQTVVEYFSKTNEGVQTLNLGPDSSGKERNMTILTLDATRMQEEEEKTITFGGHSYTLRSISNKNPGEESTINYIDGTIPPTTDTPAKRILPSLAPFLTLNEPKPPKRPKWYEDWDIKTADIAPDLPVTDWDTSWSIARHEGTTLGLKWTDCRDYDRNDKVIMDALMKVEVDGTKLNNTTAATADRLFKAGRMLKGIPKIPAMMGSRVADGTYKKVIDESVRTQFEEECVRGFRDALDNPDPLPLTKDGLDTYTWASVVSNDGKHLRVKDEKTKVGRIAQMRELRETLYGNNGAGAYGDKTISFADATRLACEATDRLHIDRDHDKGTGITKIDLVDYITKYLKNGEDLPQNWPESVLEIAKARDETNTAMSKASLKSTKPLAFDSWTGPRPEKVPAHRALWSETDTFQGDTQTDTKASLSGSLLSRLDRMKNGMSREGVGLVNEFFGQFPSRTRSQLAY